jgi:hypothetical protein
MGFYMEIFEARVLEGNLYLQIIQIYPCLLKLSRKQGSVTSGRYYYIPHRYRGGIIRSFECFMENLLARETTRCFVLYCRRQQNNFWYSKYSYETELKKTTFKALLVVRGCRLGDNLLLSTTIYMFGLSTGLFLLPANFP